MAQGIAGNRPQVLKSRNYVHGECGMVTQLDGPEFQSVANPLAEMETTCCSHCEEHFDLSEFYWEDSGETIADYYARHRKNIPDEVLERTSHAQVVRYAVRGAVIGGVIAIAIGIGIGVLTSILWGIVGGIVVAIIAIPLGAILQFQQFEKKIVQPLLEKHLGVKDVGELR